MKPEERLLISNHREGRLATQFGLLRAINRLTGKLFSVLKSPSAWPPCQYAGLQVEDTGSFFEQLKSDWALSPSWQTYAARYA